jgi:adenosylcobinamide-GDP ribazoletransferase
MTMAIAAYPYARPEGLGRAFHGSALPWAAPLALLSALVVAALLLGGAGIALWAVALTTALLLGRLSVQRLGGLTGDVYGALNELTTALVLVLFAAGWVS